MEYPSEGSATKRKSLHPGQPATAVDKGVEMVQVEHEAGQRIDNYLLGRLKGVPRARIYRMIRRGEIRINGRRCKAMQRLQAGDRVRIPPHRAPSRETSGEDPGGDELALADVLLSRVLHEDQDLLVVDKPEGVAVHGGSGVSLGVIEALRRAMDAPRLELAHRIDRDTSGCLALAKNRKTLVALHAEFREGRVGKRYDVVVDGCWPAKLRTITKPLKRYVLPNGERRVRVAADGESARTDFEVRHVDVERDATWLAAFPKTGRTHQIRVHAANAGHAVLGDDKYARGAGRGGRLMLHASELRLVVSGETMRFRAPLPEAFNRFALVEKPRPDAADRQA